MRWCWTMFVPFLLGCSQNERIAILDCVVPEEVPRDARDLEGHPYSDNLRTQFIWYGAPANGLSGSNGSWTPYQYQGEFDIHFERIKNFGGSLLVGTGFNKIVKNVNKLLRNKKLYNKMSKIKNPYGDGKATNRIINHLTKFFELNEN